MSEKTGDKKGFIKYPFQTPKPSDKGPRPDSMYINLYTYGKGTDLKVITKIYDDSGKELDKESYLNVRGRMEPCVKFEGIYWGAHGKNSHGGSLRFRLVEANFSPIIYSSVPQGRLLKSNNVEQLSFEELEGDNEDDDNPLQAMTKQPPKKAPIVPKPKQPPVKPAVATTSKKPQIQLKKAPPKPAPKKPVPPPEEELEPEVEPEFE
jgi:hypothetical protein